MTGNLIWAEFGNFEDAVNKITNDPALKELCAGEPELAVQVNREALNFVNKTRQRIEKNADLLSEEAKLLEEFSLSTKENFQVVWKKSTGQLQNLYREQELDTGFFMEEFNKSLKTDVENKNSPSFESVKGAFAEKWGGIMLRKQIERELEIIEKERRLFCEELYRRMEDLKKLKSLFGAIGNNLGRLWDLSGGSWRKIDFDVLKKYDQLLENDKALGELAELLGRMYSAEQACENERFSEKITRPEWKALYARKAELVGIRESDDISNMLPGEAALLTDETAELLFYKKFAEKKLLTFDYQSKMQSFKEDEIRSRQKEEKDKKGPFIICVDTSASMHGIPEAVAKTLCFAILKIAVRDNRKCVLISFSTGIKTLDLADIKNNLDRLVEFLSMSFQGGTDLSKAMRASLNRLETEDYRNADILVVSDFIMPPFDADTKNRIKAAKENKNKFHSLLVGGSGNDKMIAEFDNNWVYDPGNSGSMLKLVNDLHYARL